MNSRKRNNVIQIFTFLTVISVTATSFAEEISSQKENHGTNKHTTTSFVSSLNRFSFDFMKVLIKDNNKNIVFSPIGISAAISALFIGAKTETREEIAKSFHWEGIKSEELLHTMRKQTNLLLSDRKTLNVSNKLWIDKSFEIQHSFLEIQKKYFKSDLGLENFSEHPEKSRTKINKWVQERTNGKIKDLFPKGSIETSTKMVLTNALHFKGLWAMPFDKKYTKKYPFYLENGNQESIDFMWQNGKFMYGKTDNYNILEIPYTEGKFSMIIVMPAKENRKLDDLVTQMADGNLEKSIDRFRQKNKDFQAIDIFLPKFIINQKIDLKQTLQKLGIRDLFTRGKADLSGISGNHLLYCSNAYHNAFVEVNEEGTEAGAGTGFGTFAMSMPPQLRINRAFIFFIIHKDSKGVIFNGRVMDPSNNT